MEFSNLDEAIKHYDDRVEDLMAEYDIKEKRGELELAQRCFDCAEELKQLSKWLKDYRELIKPRGTYECFHCGNKTVVWDSDFDFSDYGLEGEGVIHVCHCANCGAEIEYRISNDVEGDDEDESAKRSSD